MCSLFYLLAPFHTQGPALSHSVPQEADYCSLHHLICLIAGF